LFEAVQANQATLPPCPGNPR